MVSSAVKEPVVVVVMRIVRAFYQHRGGSLRGVVCGDDDDKRRVCAWMAGYHFLCLNPAYSFRLSELAASERPHTVCREDTDIK